MKARFAKCLILVLALALLLCGCGKGEFTTTYSMDGIVVTVHTDKAAYVGTETAKVNMEITNNTGKEIAVFADVKTPDGLAVDLETLGGNFKAEPGKVVTLYDIGIKLNPLGLILWLVGGVVVLAAAAVVVIIILRKNKGKQAMAMLLCLVMLGGMVAYIQPLQAEASVFDDPQEPTPDYVGQMTVRHPVMVDGAQVYIDAVLDYEIGLPVEPVYEPLVEETDYVDPDTKKPNGKVLAWYYNDFDGDHAMYDKGANVKLSENSMELAGTQEQGYLRVEITNAATASYQADFRENELVDNFVVHFKVSTENQMPNGTYMLYRYNSKKNKELFRFKDGYLHINGKDYDKLVTGEWMEVDMVFDLTPEANDLVKFYVNGRYVVDFKLPKHQELYKIPYMRWHIIGDQTTIGSTMLLDDFMVYPGKDILPIDQVNTPNYPYYQQHTVAPDVAIDHPELEDLGNKVIAVLAGSDQAYVNGEVITMSAEAIDRSSGSAFTDASVPGDFLEKYLGVTGLDASQQYSLLQYATGKNIVVDSRGLIILTDDVVLDVDSTDIRIVTLLYGYLATGKLVNNYAIMPALDQDMVDKAVHNTEIYPATVALRSYDAMATDIALYYLVLAARLDPDRTSTDGISVEAEAVRRLKNMVAGGHEPMAAVGNSWEHGVVSSALTLARFTPSLWNQLTKEEQGKVDLLMECLAIAANWGYNLDNNYITPFDLRGSFAKNLNPNFLFAYITCYFNASMYFGAEELDEIFVNFSHAEYVERLKKAGFTNILYEWTIQDNLGLDIGYYMENGGEVLLLGDDAVIANGSAGSSLKAGETGGTGVGVKVPFKYEGMLTRKIYDSSQLLEMFMDTLELNYCWKVMSSNQAPGTMYYSYILTMVKSPWEGQMGMMREFSIGDDRSKVRYSWLSAINIAPLLSNFKLLGYWDYDANPELTQRMLELENRVYVGTEDLYFKMHQGYQGCSQKKQVNELDSSFVNEGADMIEDIFMNFLFMKNQQIVYTQPEVAQDLLEAAEPMNGITDPPEDAVITIARDPSNNYAWDLWSPLNPGVGYYSGNMSFDIVIEDQLVDSGFKSYIIIDKKFPGKGLTESPMAIYFDQLTGISVLDKNQFMPLGIFFGANYRFHVDMEFNCKDRAYSGTITQIWPETEKPITATFNNGFRTTATMGWTFVDSMMALTYTGYPLLWVENIQVDGSTLTPPALELTEDVTVTMDMSGLPTWARPSELKVNLAIGDWVSPRTVSFSAADGWSNKVFDNLPKEIGTLPVDWTVQMLQKVPGYYATVTKTGENKFTVSWSDTHYFYDNNFEAWNKGEYVAKNTPIYDYRGNSLRDYDDKASWGELTRGTEASGNDYLKIGGTKAAQATFNLDAGTEAGIYVFKMRLKLQNADDVITATHFAYRYLKDEKSVKNTFINIEKNRLEVGGYVLGTLTADEWVDIMVMLDFKTGIGEVFYDDPGYRRTFELEPISSSLITLLSMNNNGVLCIDDLQVYTCSRLSVIKPPDEANKKAELIIPSTPIPELDPAYKWYYSTDFEYWNKGDYVAGKTPIMDAYGNTMIDQWSNSYGPLVRSGDETGNHFLELNSYKTMQAQLFVDPELDDGTYIMKWRMKLKDENSVVTSAVFSYRNANNKKVDFATITEKAVKICGKSFGKLTADEWLEVMVVLDFNTLTGTVCDWEGHAISTMALKPIGGRMFNIFANGGTKGLCIDDLQLYSGSVTILDPLPGQPGDEEDPDEPADIAFESNFDAALPTEPDGDAYTYLVDANGNKLSVTNGAYSVNDGYLAVSGAADATNYLFIAEGAADVLDISFKVRLPDAETTIPGKASSGISLRTYKNDADIAKFYGQNFRINGKNYALSADQWLDISIQVDLAADKVTYNVGGETGEFEFTGSYSRLELFALAKGAFTLHIDDLRIGKVEDAWTGMLETTVIWDDGGNGDGIRPESLFVSLYDGLNLIDRKEATAASDWKCVFTELEQYDPEGNAINYTVVVASEDVPEGYTLSINGTAVTLTHVPAVITFYDNDFEDNILTASGNSTNILDANGGILVDNAGAFNVLEEADGNKFLEFNGISGRSSVRAAISNVTGPITVSFRVRWADDYVLACVNEGDPAEKISLRFRTNGQWFAHITTAGLVGLDSHTEPLSTQWLNVSFTIDPAAGKLTYQAGDYISGPIDFAYEVNGFDIYMGSTRFTCEGLHIDDLKIRTYEASEAPDDPDITEPGVTEPGVTEPGVTEPGVTEPGVTEPDLTEPGVTEPGVTEPGVTEPGVTEPGVTEPGVTEPGVTEPGVTEPGVTEPGVTEPGVTEPGVTEPAEPDTTTYFYNNDFEDYIFADKNPGWIGKNGYVLDADGNSIQDPMGYCYILEDAGNNYLNIAGSGNKVYLQHVSQTNPISGAVKISFRVRLAGALPTGTNLHFRTNSQWFTAVMKDTSGTDVLALPDGNYPLSTDWLQVSFVMDGTTLTYTIGNNPSKSVDFAVAVNGFDIRMSKNIGFTIGGVHIDDLKISAYEAPAVEPEDPTEAPTEAPTEPESVAVSLENAFGGADSIVTMTWDDAGMASSNYNTALFLNEQYRIFGLKGTLMAVTKGDKGFDNESRRLLWLDILNDGNLEMQSHSATHMYIGSDDDAEADKVNNTPENYQAEIAGSKASLEEWVPNEILAFAAAGNSMSTDGWVVVQENYYATRMGVRGVQSIDPAMGIAVGAWQNLMTQRLGTSATNTELARMTGYVDEAIEQKGWLITFAHNISDTDDVTEDTAIALFRYIADKVQSNEVWCANFGDAIRYIRERQNSTVVAVVDGDTIKITVTMAATAADGKSLPANIFNHPLTAKVEVPAEWALVTYAIDGKKEIVKTFTEDGATWAYVNILPNTTATVAEATAATTIDREVTLVWDDAADSDGIRPTTVDVQVYNGQTLVTTATVSAANGWIATLQLPKYDAQLNEITYTFNAEVEHYDDTYAAGVLTLSHTPVITYFYNNNFESDTLTVGSALTSVLDANDKTATGQFYVREETNNKFLEMKYDTAGKIAACQVTGTGNDYEVSFRVRLGAGVSTIGSGVVMRVRSTGSGWFAAFSGNQISTSDGASVTLTDEWLDVYFHVDGVNQKVTYRIGETTGTIEQYETTVDRFQIFNYRAAAYSGLYIDDLKISEYKAPEEPDEPGATEPGVTDPGVTEPGVTEPGVTEPGVTEPGVTEPGVTEPGVTEPGVTEPGVTEPGVTEPAEPDTTTYFYNNDFESYVFADKNPGWIGKNGYVLDADGNSIQDPMGYCYILEDAGNNYLNIAGSGNKVYLQHVSQTNPISGAVKISFRVRLAGALPTGTNLHFRTNSQWFTAVMKDSNGADVLACRTGNYPLSTDWLQVTVVMDGATVTYTIGDNPSTSAAFAYAVNGFDIRMSKNMSFTSGGVHIDDLKISKYVAQEEEPETVEAEVAIDWVDGDDHDCIRPDSVFVSVYNGLNLVKREQVTAANNWQHTFTELPKFDAQNNEINYTVVVVSEDLPEGYTASVTGAAITLTHEPEIT